MTTQTAPASETTATETKVAHLGCPWCWNTTSRLGDLVVSLCGALVSASKLSYTEKPAECPLCHDALKDVLEDGSCHRCP